MHCDSGASLFCFGVSQTRFIIINGIGGGIFEIY